MTEQTPILYTQTGWTDIRKLRDWLTERGVAFVVRNVTRDADAVKAFIATGLFGTPLLVVGEETVIGFRPEKLAAALGMPAEVIT